MNPNEIRDREAEAFAIGKDDGFAFEDFCKGWDAALAKDPRVVEAKRVLGMIDHVGLQEPYASIVREALAAFEGGSGYGSVE